MSTFPVGIYNPVVDDISADTLKATPTNDATYGHVTVHRNDAAELVAIETYLGTNAADTAPEANQVLAGTGTGVSDWTATPTITSLTTTNITESGGTVSFTPTSYVQVGAGKELRVYDATNTNYISVSQDSNGRIRNIGSGDLILDAATNIVRTLANNSLRVVGSGGVKYVDFAHNDTNGVITVSSGDLTINTHFKPSITNTDNNGTSSLAWATTYTRNVNTDSGSLVIASAASNVQTGNGNTLRTMGSGGSNYMQLTHDNTNGVISTNSGKLAFQPNTTTIDCYATILTGTTNTYDLGSAGKDWKDVYGQNAYTTVSDIRAKENIEDSPLGLDFILAQRTVQGTWKNETVVLPKRDDAGDEIHVKDESGNDTDEVVMEEVTQQHHRKHQWLIAQEVEQVLKDQGIDTEDFAGLIIDKETGKYCLRYGEFIPPMMKAIQELAARVKQLESK